MNGVCPAAFQTVSQFLGIFSKQTWLKVLLSWYFMVKKHEIMVIEIKFGELRCKNVNNTFMQKRVFTWKDSQSHATEVLWLCEEKIIGFCEFLNGDF